MVPLAFDTLFHEKEKPVILSSSPVFSTVDRSHQSLHFVNTARFCPYIPDCIPSIVLWQSPVLRMAEGDTIYDYCWYPKMTSLDPDTCL